MSSNHTRPDGQNTILLFGSQALSFQKHHFDELRATIFDEPENHWVINALSELPTYWETFEEKFPKLQAVPGKKLLQDLNDALKNGIFAHIPSKLPNILLSPLVVMMQLTQYTSYLKIKHAGEEQQDLYAAHSPNTETLGYCTGLLSALAVSSATDKTQFQRYGAVAARLALLIAGLVDAQDVVGEYKNSTAFATVWNSQEAKMEMENILQQFPEAYVSVWHDGNRATITTSTSTASAFQQQLRDAGIIATEIGLKGRFHCEYHRDDIDALIRFCDSDPKLQFPNSSELVLPTWSSSSNSGDIVSQQNLHHVALRSILVEQSNWYRTFSAVNSSRLYNGESLVVCFGPERCVPPSFLRSMSAKVIYMIKVDEKERSWLAGGISKEKTPLKYPKGFSENDIAVVGMSIKVAGADDLEEFWKILCEGKSQHVEVPKERFGFETQWRDHDPKRKWYGNFMRDHDAFDNKFFKKTPREAASQDPQQRLILQAAYQAVEQSGYFNKPDASTHVGCYLGVCSVDYENNIACHPANAFSATGTLRSFIAGKVSHYFGWTGPGLTIDTACSASAVAVHQACRAILGGECTAALAGGTMVMSSPLLFQNLAGASFLSPTGSCKPFDAKADGYCRGEGIATVFLKKMSQAVSDGDIIHGCIASTAVYQNGNCTPIVVPNAPSLSELFKDVINKAGLEPHQISAVEAHGTGTPVGDPAEYESIKRVVGGPIRSKPLPIGSVKGLVGHTESVSGVISLIKILLMIQEAAIPPQASFQTLNPHIQALESDMMEVVTQLKTWDADFRAALINNYGASGSNASLVVTQAFQHEKAGSSFIHSAGIKHPFWLTGFDERNLREYSVRLRQFIRSRTVSAKGISLANLAFNISRQSNRSLNKGFIFGCSSVEELDDMLTAIVNREGKLTVTTKKPSRPIILCFGGQICTSIGLDRKVYDSIGILRHHLDKCNSVLEKNRFDSIYPEIFLRTPIKDTVKLQTMLFALQYSMAKTWLDCGVQVAAIIGYSFGELTGLCISGALSLEDAIKVVAARAKLIQDFWGMDRGSMMAIEADLDEVQKLLADSSNASKDESPVTIACFNGPRSFTLAGSTKAIDALVEKVSTTSSMRTKKLNVTNAFHCSLVEPLVTHLEQLGQGLTLHEAKIPLERATKLESEKLSSKFFAEHMRNPVYFNDAIQRLSKKYQSAIWLEAGSNSTITTMASRAFGSPNGSHFQAINVNNDNGLQNLADITISLWKEGMTAPFWAHHNSQTYEYLPILLPPYQFEKTRHWLELKKPQKAIVEVVSQQQAQHVELPTGLYTFTGYQDNKQRSARFRVNTMTKEYKSLVSGHLLAETAPICPATVEVDIAIEAISSLYPAFSDANLQAQIKNVENQAPICVDPSRSVWLDIVALDTDWHKWEWKISSTGQKSSVKTEHVSGQIIFCMPDDPEVLAEFAKYERLFGHRRCLEILENKDADDIIQGRNIYKTFAPVVNYGEQYRGLQKLVGKGNMSAGRVMMEYSKETWLDAYLSDCFCQVGGIWVNCMTDLSSKDMYIANKIGYWIRSPKIENWNSKPKVWDVFACHHQLSDKVYVTDIFVFEATSGTLMEVILGINYARVSKLSMSKLLSRMTPEIADTPQAAAVPSQAVKVDVPSITAVPFTPLNVSSTSKVPIPKKEGGKQIVRRNISDDIREMLAELVGLEMVDIKETTELADIGIDSLMGMELAHEIEGIFKCSLPTEELFEVLTVRDLVRCVQAVLKPIQDGANVESSGEDEDDKSTDSDQSNSVNIDGRSAGDQVFGTPSEATTIFFGVGIDLVDYLSEFLALDKSEVVPDMLLRDLGVDSLLSTELRSDLFGKFHVEISEDVAIEELTVGDLGSIIKGDRGDTPESVSMPPEEIHTPQKKSIEANSKVFYSHSGGLDIPPAAITKAFEETKMLTDQYIADAKFVNYLDVINPKQTQMCIALIVEAFEQLGCSLRTTTTGQKIQRIKYLPQHSRLVEYLYVVLEGKARLIDTEGDQITRTAISPPAKSSSELLQDLMHAHPNHDIASRLAFYTGRRLADVLTGKSDGVKIIFGEAEGRELVTGLYGDWPLNKMYYEQMADFIKRLVSKLPMNGGPLKILEMGAGTGGTTKVLVPMLASLNVPLEYTFTDLSMSFVAAARKRFKQYPFMKYRTHDIERTPADDLLATQHIIIASNAVHATHSLTESTRNIHKALRPDGFLIMLEMTSPVVWIDIIFGLLEGWWLFDDGRRHAIAHQSRWEHDLQSVGYGHVDWTDGNNSEVNIERIIIALASGPRYERLNIPPIFTESQETDCTTRQAVIDQYVLASTEGFVGPNVLVQKSLYNMNNRCVLITGATGSLGSHCVASFARLPNVKTVVCLNRHSSRNTPEARQQQALESRGIKLDNNALSKVKVFASDSAKANLGLPSDVYKNLTSSVTHILHNAWPMSARRPVEGFIGQFRVMRNLVDLAVAISQKRESQVGFQLISSIATVGHYPLWSGRVIVPEERMTVKSILPNGYGDAKFVCERILDETLHKYPKHFRTMVVRPGQIAGSSFNGYWNSQEHLPFLIKSAQTLKALPSFKGLLSWTPVNDVAATLSDLLMGDNDPYPIYHVDNPVRQSWTDMISLLADTLDIPPGNEIPSNEWFRRVRAFPGSHLDNPAVQLIEFLDDNFVRMSCGGLLLDTTRAREHSKTLASVRPVEDDVVRKYINAWKATGFLH